MVVPEGPCLGLATTSPVDPLDGPPDYSSRDSDVDMRRSDDTGGGPRRVGRIDSPCPDREEARVKRFEMRPPSSDGKGSVRTFSTKFDNCALYNRWTETERLHYLVNCLEDPAAQYCGPYGQGIIIHLGI